jgi:hypothetical protein
VPQLAIVCTPRSDLDYSPLPHFGADNAFLAWLRHRRRQSGGEGVGNPMSSGIRSRDGVPLNASYRTRSLRDLVTRQSCGFDVEDAERVPGPNERAGVPTRERNGVRRQATGTALTARIDRLSATPVTFGWKIAVRSPGRCCVIFSGRGGSRLGIVREAAASVSAPSPYPLPRGRGLGGQLFLERSLPRSYLVLPAH